MLLWFPSSSTDVLCPLDADMRVRRGDAGVVGRVRGRTGLRLTAMGGEGRNAWVEVRLLLRVWKSQGREEAAWTRKLPPGRALG